jgi:hypothetical protein
MAGLSPYRTPDRMPEVLDLKKKISKLEERLEFIESLILKNITKLKTKKKK